jgi:hypothetical protein
MSLYEARASIEKVAGSHRRVTLATGDAFETGVHGAIKAHYRLDNEKDLPLPVDYIVGATGA